MISLNDPEKIDDSQLKIENEKREVNWMRPLCSAEWVLLIEQYE